MRAIGGRRPTSNRLNHPLQREMHLGFPRISLNAGHRGPSQLVGISTSSSVPSIALYNPFPRPTHQTYQTVFVRHFNSTKHVLA